LREGARVELDVAGTVAGCRDDCNAGGGEPAQRRDERPFVIEGPHGLVVVAQRQGQDVDGRPLVRVTEGDQLAGEEQLQCVHNGGLVGDPVAVHHRDSHESRFGAVLTDHTRDERAVAGEPVEHAVDRVDRAASALGVLLRWEPQADRLAADLGVPDHSLPEPRVLADARVEKGDDGSVAGAVRGGIGSRPGHRRATRRPPSGQPTQSDTLAVADALAVADPFPVPDALAVADPFAVPDALAVARAHDDVAQGHRARQLRVPCAEVLQDRPRVGRLDGLVGVGDDPHAGRPVPVQLLGHLETGHEVAQAALPTLLDEVAALEHLLEGRDRVEGAAVGHAADQQAVGDVGRRVRWHLVADPGRRRGIEHARAQAPHRAPRHREPGNPAARLGGDVGLLIHGLS
jgi:hypothetical protein